MRPAFWIVVAVAVGSISAPTPVVAQTDLDEIEALASMGRAEGAREALATWWEDDRGGATRAEVQRALWLRARLTVDPSQAARDFRRLVVEYPGGPFTDRALYRLAHAAYAAGDTDRARAHVATLTRDYPASPVREEAEAWFVGAGPPVGPAVADAAAGADTAASGAEEEVSAVSDAEARREEPTPPAQEPRPSRSVGRYAVQLGAFSSSERAESLRSQAEEAGFDVRVVRVRGSRLLHVRVGTFDSSGEASVFFRRVTDRGFTAAVVRDADKEEPARE